MGWTRHVHMNSVVWFLKLTFFFFFFLFVHFQTCSVSSSVSQRMSSYTRNASTSSLFSRGSTQTLSLSLPSTPAAPSMSPVKILAGKSFRDRNAKKDSPDKKIRDKENKRQRDSFRRLSSSSIGKSTPFSGLSLAGFGLGQSSMTLFSFILFPSINLHKDWWKNINQVNWLTEVE